MFESCVIRIRFRKSRKGGASLSLHKLVPTKTGEKAEVLLADILLRPRMSLVHQSYAARERRALPQGVSPSSLEMRVGSIGSWGLIGIWKKHLSHARLGQTLVQNWLNSMAVLISYGRRPNLFCFKHHHLGDWDESTMMWFLSCNAMEPLMVIPTEAFQDSRVMLPWWMFFLFSSLSFQMNSESFWVFSPSRSLIVASWGASLFQLTSNG